MDPTAKLVTSAARASGVLTTLIKTPGLPLHTYKVLSAARDDLRAATALVFNTERKKLELRKRRNRGEG